MPITDWEFRWDDDPPDAWRPAVVPGCWEDQGEPKDRPGPAWYRARLAIPPDLAGRRVFLRFGAVSYHCAVFVGGGPAGGHLGAWDAFEVEVTGLARPGEASELLLRVEKPASLTSGPASPPVPGAFPLKRTLAGFLPYVWGHLFGGVWQGVAVTSSGPARIIDLAASGTPDGRTTLTVTLDAPADVEVEVRDPDGEIVQVVRAAQGGGEPVAGAQGSTRNAQCLTLVIPSPRPWSPADPARYTAAARVDGQERVVRFGLRSLRAEGDRLLLNERPIYPRMILSWGWYPDRLHPDPGPERVREDFARLRSLGYNGVKLCLWFPPQYYFDIADEEGMLLWVELPMWLPDPDPFFREQTPNEYARLVRLARNHPSVVLYSLGCELNRAVGPEILGPLYELVKREGGGALVRDNSGSGEAYGGLLNEFADYYDYHFYCELPFFRPLVESFSPRWRPQKPWVFGEFCDYDTFRDLGSGQRAAGSGPGTDRSATIDPLPAALPFWLSPDPRVNPQGARWQFDAPFLEERLRSSGLWERSAELARLSHLHGLLHRKFTLELVRTYREITGYVVTGEADTPISTAGMWDEWGGLKFDPAAFHAFNQDLVLALGWDKRRAWVGGGDRAAFYDTFSYHAGALVRPHVILSHYGAAEGPASVVWSVALAGEEPFASGEATSPFALSPGDVRELTVAEFHAPAVTSPRRATLRARAAVGGEQTENAWPLWFFPPGAWDGLAPALYDPMGRLADLPLVARGTRTVHDTDLQRATLDTQRPTPLIATAWSPAVDEYVKRGGACILLQAGAGPAGPIPTTPLPFWREAVRVCEPHPAWGDFPHDGWAGLPFFGCAPDHALDSARLAGARPILRRVDTRTAATHDYACEIGWGTGRLIVTTLRFEGGAGEQPAGIARSAAAGELLARWVRWLRDML